MKTIEEIEGIVIVNYDTYKEVFRSIILNTKPYYIDILKEENIINQYRIYLEDMEETRFKSVKWWEGLREGTKRVLMERYWSKFRPYIQQPHFVSININNISGREIEIIYNEEHN